jgi:small nuclear ribonucleoprotein (snRNP)-like protein
LVTDPIQRTKHTPRTVAGVHPTPPIIDRSVWQLHTRVVRQAGQCAQLMDAARGARADAAVKLNANRHVVGTLRGYDAFMNLVLDEAVEQGQEKHNLGMVSGLASCAGREITFRGHDVREWST